MRKKRYRFPEYNWVVGNTQFSFRLNVTEYEEIEYPIEIHDIDRDKSREYAQTTRDGMTDKECEERIEYNRQWRLDNLNHVIEYDKQRRLDNLPMFKQKDHDRYWSDPIGQRQRVKEYRTNNPELVRLAKLTQHERRSGWGIESINECFEGAHFHHLHINGNHSIGLYIPKELHKSVWHSFNDKETMNEINKLAFEWLIRTDIPGSVILKFNKLDKEGLANTSNTQQKNNQEVI